MNIDKWYRKQIKQLEHKYLSNRVTLSYEDIEQIRGQAMNHGFWFGILFMVVAIILIKVIV